MPAVGSITSAVQNEIIRILQQDIKWFVQPGDQPLTIQPSAIVFRKPSAQIARQGQQSLQGLDMPGLLVSRTYRTTVNPNEWTNEIDLWRRHFLVQIIDHDEGSNTDRVDTWNKWEEQIISAFMFNCLPNAQLPYDPQWIITTATSVQDIDERHWAKDLNFISGVDIEVRVSQPRGIIA